MASESLQKKVGRVRPPRVQITYDVETGGKLQKTELPFVVGVMADLSGQPKEPLAPLKERKFVNIDRDNIDEVMKKANTRLAMKVDNKLTNDGSKMAVELNFKGMEDFEPQNIAKQVGPLKELLDMRSKLKHLLSKTEGNDKLEALLGDIINNTEKAVALSKLGDAAGGASGEEEAK